MNHEPFSTIAHVLKAYEKSDRTALICGEERLTYRELLADARHIAKGLVSEGIKKGDRVLHCMRRSADAIRAVLGIVYAGGVFVTVDPDWPEQRRSFVAADTEVVFSMTDEACQRLKTKELPGNIALPQMQGEDEISIIYTSGSTGKPKGTILCHKLYGTEILYCSSHHPSWERFQVIVKFSYINAFEDCFKVLAIGKTVLLSTEEMLTSLDHLGAFMDRYEADAIAGTPSMILRFLDHPSFAHAFARMKSVRFFGEKVTMSVIDRVRQTAGEDTDIFLSYGCSEMVNCGNYHYRNDGKLYLGEAPDGVQRYILDEHMKPVEPGQEGELFIGGFPAQLGRYVNRPELNAAKYVEHPIYGHLFRMGDLVRLERNGELTVTGRKDGMVKLRGQRIETAEVEKRVEQFEGIRRAAVKLIGQSPRDALACWYTASAEISETQLRRFLAESLPYYMVPSAFMRLATMPESDHGKLSYKDLPSIELPEQVYQVPETEEEKLLCDSFREVLQLDRPFGRNDSFLAMGGDSISAMAAAAHLQAKGYTFAPHLIFLSPTPAQLAPMLTPISGSSEQTARMQEELSIRMTTEENTALDLTVGHEHVECLYPVMRVVSEKLDERASYLLYDLWAVDAAEMPKERFERRLTELTNKHQALRSVFLLQNDGEHRQVVLRSHAPQMFFVDLRALSEGEAMSPKQKAYFRNLIQMDASRPKDLEREVLFKAGLVKLTETKSVMFFAVSHLLLDGTGITQMVRELAGTSDIAADRNLWNQRIWRMYHSDHSESERYWKHLLQGMSRYSRIPMHGSGTGQLSPGQTYAAGGSRLWKQMTEYCRERQITLSAYLHYAFGRMLMELLNTDDVCFLSEGNQRTAEEAQLVGMCILRFPVRIRRDMTLTECQAQLASSMAHMEVCGIRGTDWDAGFGSVYGVLDVQNVLLEQKDSVEQIGLDTLTESAYQIREMERDILLTHRERNAWFLRVWLDGKQPLSCTAAYNTDCYDRVFMSKVTGEYIKQLKSIMKEDR